MRDKKRGVHTHITKFKMSVSWTLIILISMFLVVGIPTMCATQESKAFSVECDATIEIPTTEAVEDVATITTPEPTGTITLESPNDYISFTELVDNYATYLQDSGFRYYQIPEVYEKGAFPENVQAYLWSLCKERELDYYIVVALIERESGYNPNCTGDSGASKGYMQIQEKWHKWRMDTEDVTDLYDPYGNIRVGLNFLGDLHDKYGDWTKVLMCYNMGQSGAKKCWDKGIYSTAYSRRILQRAQEIEQELKD